MPSTRGFGITAGVPEEVATELARRADRLGYASIWANDTPRGDGLGHLAAYAKGSDRLRLGVGVLPLDRHPTEAIAARVRELGLPPERLWLGVGSGQSKQPLALVRARLPELRAALPGVAIVLGAVGPKMLRLAGELADGALLNWMTPPTVQQAKAQMGAGNRARALMYVRAALEPGGRERIGREAAGYARQPHYARAFEANGVPPELAGVAGRGPEDFDPQLAPYEAVLDETIVRALPASGAPEDLFALLEAARPS